MLFPALALAGWGQFLPAPPASGETVALDVQVADKGTGQVLEFLRPDDFVILDNGQPRPVRELHFASAPLDIVFVVSSHIWLPGRQGNDISRGLREAVEQLRDGDRAAVLYVDSAPGPEAVLTNDREVVLRALSGAARRGVSVGGRFPPTMPPFRLYDAVNLAATLFPGPREQGRRRAIVALTVDAEKGSKIEMEPLIAALLEADMTLNAVIVERKKGGIRGGNGPIPGAPPDIVIGGTPITGESILPAVEATGGESLPGGRFQEALPELMWRLQLRYLLGYEAGPANEDGYHKLEVRLAEDARQRYPNVQIRAKRGYHGAPPAVGPDTPPSQTQNTRRPISDFSRQYVAGNSSGLSAVPKFGQVTGNRQ